MVNAFRAPDMVPPAAGSGDDRRAHETQSIIEQLREDFKDRDALYARIDKVLHGEIPISVPPAFQQIAAPVRSPMPMHIKNTVAAALSVNYPHVQCKPLGFGDAWEENATTREHFFEGSFRRQEKDAGRPVFRLFMDALVAKGEGVLKTVERTKRAWPGYPSLSKKILEELDGPEWKGKGYTERRKSYDDRTEEYKQRQPYPIATTDVLPETFYYLKGTDGTTIAAEVKRVPYLDTLARYGMALDRTGSVVPQAMGLPVGDWHSAMDKERHLWMAELWTHKTCTCLLFGPGQMGSRAGISFGNGTLVKSFDHGYGDPATKTLRGPYFHAQGILSHHRAPHRAGTGILTPFLDLFVLQDNLLTMRLGNAYMTAWASWKRNRPQESGIPDSPFGNDGTEKNRKALQIVPGTVIDDDIGPVEMPRAGADFNRFGDDVRSFLELALPSVLQGAVDTTESGWQLAQAVHLARLAWDPIVSNAERALSDRTSFESWMIEHRIGERVYARGEVSSKDGSRTKGGHLSVGPDDLKGFHDVYEVKLNPELPSTEVVKLRYWGEAVERGFASEADAIADLGRNPDEVDRQRRLEKIKKSEFVEGRIIKRVEELLGLAEAAAAEEAAQAGGGLPQPGGDPGAALQGMANPMVPGQNMPLEPTPQTPGGATAPMPGNPPGMAGGIPAERMIGVDAAGRMA